jgi:subtilase family serine protease
MARSTAPSLELAAGETADIVVSLKLRNAAQLKQLARDVNRPGNAHYGQYLTHEQFVADYAPTEAQVKSVVDYLRKSGFVNIEVAPNRLLVSAHGTAGTVKTAFNTSLVHFQYAGRAGFANASTAQVPRARAATSSARCSACRTSHARARCCASATSRSRRRSRPARLPATIRRNSPASTTRPACRRRPA